MDCHGTHVAGIAGAIGNNGKGISGVAQKASLVSYKITTIGVNEKGEPTDYAADSDTIRYINEAASYWGTSNQISVINYSFSGFGLSDNMLYAIRSFPGIFVWSAGNDSQPISNNDYRFTTNLISVGAYDMNGDISDFSNWGDAVSIYAPGTDILSTVRGGGYDSWCGTSMAAPHVSGTAALIYTKYPNLTARQVKEAIVNSVDYVTVEHTGLGIREPIKRLNVRSALEYARSLCENSSSEPLHLEMLNSQGSEWKVLASNVTEGTMRVAYRPKTTTEALAKSFAFSAGLREITIAGGSSKILSIKKDGNNEYVSALTYKNSSQVQTVTYLYKNTWDTWSQVNLPVYSEGIASNSIANSRVNSTYFVSSSVSPVTFTVKGSRINWFVRDWKITIKNNMSSKIYVRYNSKMCFYNDGKNWTNLHDTNNVVALNGYGETSAFWVFANGTADAIAMAIEYVNEYGFNMRYTTVANGINEKGHNSDGHAFVAC